MGVKVPFESFNKTKQLLKAWSLPWVNKQTGGVLTLISFIAIAMVICMIKTQNTLMTKQSEIGISTAHLQQTEKLLVLNDTYQSELNSHSKSENFNNFLNFNKPVTIEKLKEFLKRWQTSLRIKTLDVEIGTPEPYNQGQNIMMTPLKLTAHVLNDKILYQLIEKLRNDAPGLIVISNVEFKRTAMASVETLNQLVSGKTTPLIEGKIICNWFFLGVQ